jgi:hypothetical protein
MTDLSAVSKDFFGSAVEPYIQRARLPETDLLPIVPPNAKLRDGTKIDPKMRGKVPGRFSRVSGDWVGLVGTWPVEGISPALAAKARSWPTQNIGLRAANWPGLDIDVADPALRDLIEQLAVEFLGPAPVRERDNAPRSLLVYRAAGDDPILKTRLMFEVGGAKHAVELLAAGQQYLIAGTHPSGAAYRWRHGFELVEWGSEGLTPVTAADVRGFFAALLERLVTMGASVTAQRQQHVPGEGVAVSDVEPIVPLELALDALRAVPNNEQNLPTREAFLGRLASFKAAVGRLSEQEDVIEAARAWATKDGYADDDYFDHCWQTLTHVRASPEGLIRAARRSGWHGDAKADFAGAEEAEEVIQEIQQAEQTEQELLAAAAKQVVYWTDQQVWIVTGSGSFLSHNALNYHPIGLTLAAAGASGLKSAAARLRNSGLVRDVAGVTYSPGAPAVYNWTWEGRTGVWFNRWKGGPSLAGDAGDVTKFLELVEWMLPDPVERDKFLDWMAFIVQNPGKKVRWAPVLIGAQGIGKDTMLKPLVWALGHHNVAEISPSNLLDRWTAYYESQLVIVQEMLRLDKVEVYERVKAAITGTGANTLLVEKKFQPAYPVPNNVAFIFLTNHSDAFAVAADDRRFFVLQCAPPARRADEYYNDLHSWYDAGGVGRVARWLAKRDVRAFRADTAPEWTQAKQAMLEETLPLFAQWLATEVIEPDGRWYGRTTIPVSEVRNLMYREHSLPAKVRDSFNYKTMTLGFKALGWVRPNNAVPLPDGSRQRVWTSDHDLMSATSAVLAARVAAETKTREFGVVIGGKT